VSSTRGRAGARAGRRRAGRVAVVTAISFRRARLAAVLPRRVRAAAGERLEPRLDAAQRALELVADLEQRLAQDHALDEHLGRVVGAILGGPDGGQRAGLAEDAAEVRRLVAGRLQPRVLLAQEHHLGEDGLQRLAAVGGVGGAGGAAAAPPAQGRREVGVGVRLGFLRVHSTVTVFARLRGWSTSSPRRHATR
jgi:hypothetical protein